MPGLDSKLITATQDFLKKLAEENEAYLKEQGLKLQNVLTQIQEAAQKATTNKNQLKLELRTETLANALAAILKKQNIQATVQNKILRFPASAILPTASNVAPQQKADNPTTKTSTPTNSKTAKPVSSIFDDNFSDLPGTPSTQPPAAPVIKPKQQPTPSKKHLPLPSTITSTTTSITDNKKTPEQNLKEKFLKTLKNELFGKDFGANILLQKWQVAGEGFFGKKTPEGISYIAEKLQKVIFDNSPSQDIEEIFAAIKEKLEEKQTPYQGWFCSFGRNNRNGITNEFYEEFYEEALRIESATQPATSKRPTP